MSKSFLPIFLIAFSLIFSSCLSSKNIFPANADQIIKSVEAKGMPNLLMGRIDSVESEGLTIEFESIGNEQNPTIVFVMGFGADGVSWPKDLVDPLLAANYHVVRFDNRDVGNSDWTPMVKKKNAYLFKNMAADVLAIVNKLGKDKVHIFGGSMGGMIAQEFALNYPERTLSLISMSSTGYYFDPLLPSVSLRMVMKGKQLTKKYDKLPKTNTNKIKHRIETLAFLGINEMATEIELVKVSEEWLYRNTLHPNPNKHVHHKRAIVKSGSRLKRLKKMQTPTLILHGDKDGLIKVVHSKKLARIIPNNDFVILNNVGHVPRFQDFEIISKTLLRFLNKQDSSKATKQVHASK